MIYYAKMKKQSGGWLVDFPELPGCATEGSSREEALFNAHEALNGWLAANCDRDLKIPAPVSRKGIAFQPVNVDLPVAFAIRLRSLRAHKGLTQAQAAKRLGISQQGYAKLESPTKTNPSLTTLQKISEALGIEVDVRLVS